MLLPRLLRSIAKQQTIHTELPVQ
uniref:Uncharacterized protein n=1 Tax=Anguilla anguilla TaxID=7936 RepID=A0A0E9VEE7_ANGAN